MTAIAMRLAGGAAAMPLLEGLGWGFCAALIWGGYLAFARAGVVGGIAPLDFALLRYGTAALLVLPVLPRLGLRDLGGIGWRRGAVLALLAGPAFILLATWGYRFAPLAHGAVVQPAVVTIATMALAVLLLRETIAARRWLGVGVVIAGLALVSGAGMGNAGAWKGDLLFAAAGLLWALFTIACRAWRVDAWHATVAVAVLGGAAIIPVWLWLGDAPALAAQGWSVIATQALVQGALSGVLAVFAFGRAVVLLGPARAAMFPAMVPALAVLAGIPVAGEWPEPVQWLGLTTVLCGLPLAMGLMARR
ncbi:EamA/RhaT family transporter [Falsiroseomonas bella]|uniref:EamA/RhaT family transporter n=1 Tax=Falsiroseomonas bella TaxID=2184016 RepID=A0A317FIQ8_9PROT|nr:DMT family transporter [Falsiroseomonas bella]PWS37456.1 EamA/RhaT family transporter [Falsiroseomonas bella]